MAQCPLHHHFLTLTAEKITIGSSAPIAGSPGLWA